MTPAEAIITAARHYCKENYTYWANRYANERTGQEFPEYSYSDNDYDLFPRYNVLSAILGEVEMLVGKPYPELNTCREALEKIGHTAQSALTNGENNEIENAAMQDERNKFIHYIATITPEELELVKPLPHRRRLDKKESEEVRQQLLERWNYDGGYWDPIEARCPTASLFLPKEEITEADYQSIIHFISTTATPYLLEITEDETDAEITSAQFHPNCYETIYCDENYEWLIYGSHESTITFAGEELLAFIKTLFVSREELFDQWPEYD